MDLREFDELTRTPIVQRVACGSLQVISLLPTLKDALYAQLNAEAITAELRNR